MLRGRSILVALTLWLGLSLGVLVPLHNGDLHEASHHDADRCSICLFGHHLTTPVVLNVAVAQPQVVGIQPESSTAPLRRVPCIPAFDVRGPPQF